MWRGNCFSHQLPWIPHPVLGKQLFFTEFTEYLKLERTHKDHCVPTLCPAQDTPKQSHPVPESVVQTLLTLLQSSWHLFTKGGIHSSTSQANHPCPCWVEPPSVSYAGLQQLPLLAVGMDILEGASPLDYTRKTATPFRNAISCSS